MDEQRGQNNEATPHKATKAGKEGTRRTVHDPTTQKEVQIEDVDTDFMNAVENPQVCSLSDPIFTGCCLLISQSSSRFLMLILEKTL